MTQIRLWLPHNADNYDQLRDMIAHRFSDMYGGSTLYQATGQWVDDDNELIEEPVVVIESYTPDSKAKAFLNTEDLAERVKEMSGEDAIMFAINHDHSLI